MNLARTPRERVQDARMSVLRAPCGGFYAHPLLRCTLEAKPLPRGRMATDSERLYYDPDKIAESPNSELDYVCVHEACHILNGHSFLLRRWLNRYPQYEEEARMALECEVASQCRAANIGTAHENQITPDTYGLEWDREASYYFRELREQKDSEDDPAQESDASPDGESPEDDASEDASGQGHDADVDIPEREEDTGGESSDTGDEACANSGGGTEPAEPDDSDGSADAADAASSDEQDGEADGGGSAPTAPSDAPGADPFAFGDVIPADEENPVKETEALVQAITAAGGVGSSPAWAASRLTRLCDTSKNKIRTALYRLFSRTHAGMSFHRPSRKHHGGAILRPGRKVSHDLKYVAVCEDVSGSTLGFRDFFWSVVYDVGKQFPRAKLLYVPWDACVHEEDVCVLDGASVPKENEVKYAGGTCVSPTFEWLRANGRQYPFVGAVFLTDCEFCDLPKAAPNFPVLWCKVGDYPVTPAWGQTVEMQT